MSFIVLLHGHASSQVIFLTSVRSVDVEIGFDFGEAGWRGPWPLSCGASAPRPLWQATLGHRLLQLQDHAHTHTTFVGAIGAIAGCGAMVGCYCLRSFTLMECNFANSTTHMLMFDTSIRNKLIRFDLICKGLAMKGHCSRNRPSRMRCLKRES